ncbi:hypothetical protein ABZ330_32655 [Streptomyces sp. NPDC006172]|uniref:hypothetical protein n=1 Tax=Streptomyces sp. NPDC006172 TaxID=3154470 RepID=UPI0033CB15FC
MSRSAGAHIADPCPRCFVEAARQGRPTTVEGRDVVGYRCDRCSNEWVRPVEDDLDVHDVVRVDLPNASLYGEVWRVEGDRVQIRGTGGVWLRWVERWRVVVH